MCISGKWAPSPNGKQQSHELQAKHVQILGDHDASVSFINDTEFHGCLTVYSVVPNSEKISEPGILEDVAASSIAPSCQLIVAKVTITSNWLLDLILRSTGLYTDSPTHHNIVRLRRGG